MMESNIQVKLKSFDGPLGLLLSLIQREEMSIRELDLTYLTRQYLDFLHQMKDLNFDLAGEYLYLAATLVLIKSKNSIEEESLTSEEKEALDNTGIRTKAELIARLEELARFQTLGEKLWAQPKKNVDVFTHPKIDRKAIINSILTPMDLTTLTMTMVDLIKREKRKFTMLKRDRLSIKEKLRKLKENLKVGESTDFFSLVDAERSTDDVVITFISLLELARLSKVRVFQNEEMGNIYVDVVGDLQDFDVETANGFETEEELKLAKEAEALAKLQPAVVEEAAFVGEVPNLAELPELPTEENIDEVLSATDLESDIIH
ncbi:MAG: segregation and condensation protein A [Bacteriovoracaceae bacterium]